MSGQGKGPLSPQCPAVLFVPTPGKTPQPLSPAEQAAMPPRQDAIRRWRHCFSGSRMI